MSCRPISVMTRYYSFYPLKSRNINNDFNNCSTCNHVSFLGLIMHLCFDSDSRKKRGKKREREGRKERKKEKGRKKLFLSPPPTTANCRNHTWHYVTHHPQSLAKPNRRGHRCVHRVMTPSPMLICALTFLSTTSLALLTSV